MQMPAPDHHAAYQKHRLALHETTCREIATALCNPRYPQSHESCHIRRCRRDYLCSGPMHPCEQLLEKQRLRQRLGLPAMASTDLPVRIVRADSEVFELFEALQADYARSASKDPHRDWVKAARTIRFLLRHPHMADELRNADGADDL